MLKMDDDKRASLVQKGALEIDGDGDEVLTGLSLAESHFFLVYEEHPAETHSAAETAVYLQLKHKHLVARTAPLLPPQPK